MARIAASRHFANSLRRIIDEHFEGNMSELSRKSKVAMGTIGHYVRPGPDGRFPSVSQAEKLMKAVPSEVRMDLMRAMIADVVPPSFLAKVEIRPAGPNSKSTPVANLKGVPASTRAALEFLGDLASESIDIRRMIETTAVAMGLKS